mmetsp:Transcript_69628/g.185732  ORF Transcript_69628/g.185732 Transcript_69628/m.185732 type:complete len:347 (+) Transcript_69628:1207-2247(+)
MVDHDVENPHSATEADGQDRSGFLEKNHGRERQQRSGLHPGCDRHRSLGPSCTDCELAREHNKCSARAMGDDDSRHHHVLFRLGNQQEAPHEDVNDGVQDVRGYPNPRHARLEHDPRLARHGCIERSVSPVQTPGPGPNGSRRPHLYPMHPVLGTFEVKPDRIILRRRKCRLKPPSVRCHGNCEGDRKGLVHRGRVVRGGGACNLTVLFAEHPEIRDAWGPDRSRRVPKLQGREPEMHPASLVIRRRHEAHVRNIRHIGGHEQRNHPLHRRPEECGGERVRGGPHCAASDADALHSLLGDEVAQSIETAVGCLHGVVHTALNDGPALILQRHRLGCGAAIGLELVA